MAFSMLNTGLRPFGFLLLLICFVVANSAYAQPLQEQIKAEGDYYIQALSQSSGADLDSLANKISGSGLNDVRVFKAVQAKLLQLHQALLAAGSRDKVLGRNVNTLLRALASSGDSQYQASLQKVLDEAKSRGVRNRAKHALNKLSFYRERNQIMQDMSKHKAGQSLFTTRLLNLLNSADLRMSRFAAEEITRQGSAEQTVQAWLAQSLEAKAFKPQDKLQADTLAWYAKALGTVNKAQYHALLTKIANDESVDIKIRKHTKKILSR